MRPSLRDEPDAAAIAAFVRARLRALAGEVATHGTHRTG